MSNDNHLKANLKCFSLNYQKHVFLHVMKWRYEENGMHPWLTAVGFVYSTHTSTPTLHMATLH